MLYIYERYIVKLMEITIGNCIVMCRSLILIYFCNKIDYTSIFDS